MGRYVLFCREASPDPDDLRDIENEPGVTVLNHEVARAMLVEASVEAAASLRSKLEKWTIAKEETYPSPMPGRPSVKREDEG
jgi:hypothetical protein